jgi:hypothetical protein
MWYCGKGDSLFEDDDGDDDSSYKEKDHDSSDDEEEVDGNNYTAFDERFEDSSEATSDDNDHSLGTSDMMLFRMSLL